MAISIACTVSRSRSASSATRFLKSAVKRRLCLLTPVSPLDTGVHISDLSAIRGFFRFVAIEEPALLLHYQQVIAIPAKREVKRTFDFLDRAESAALLATPDLSTGSGGATGTCCWSPCRPAFGSPNSSA